MVNVSVSPVPQPKDSVPKMAIEATSETAVVALGQPTPAPPRRAAPPPPPTPEDMAEAKRKKMIKIALIVGGVFVVSYLLNIPLIPLLKSVGKWAQKQVKEGQNATVKGNVTVNVVATTPTPLDTGGMSAALISALVRGEKALSKKGKTTTAKADLPVSLSTTEVTTTTASTTASTTTTEPTTTSSTTTEPTTASTTTTTTTDPTTSSTTTTTEPTTSSTTTTTEPTTTEATSTATTTTTSSSSTTEERVPKTSPSGVTNGETTQETESETRTESLGVTVAEADKGNIP